MTKKLTPTREAPFSLRLSFQERAVLQDRAGNMPLSSYIKPLLFAEDAAVYRKRRSAPQADEKLLAEVLACLGASRLSNTMNQLAKAANSGVLIVDPDTKKDIKSACEDIRMMRMLLMEALGKQVENAPRPNESASQSFTRAAANKPNAPVDTRKLRP